MATTPQHWPNTQFHWFIHSIYPLTKTLHSSPLKTKHSQLNFTTNTCTISTTTLPALTDTHFTFTYTQNRILTPSHHHPYLYYFGYHPFVSTYSHFYTIFHTIATSSLYPLLHLLLNHFYTYSNTQFKPNYTNFVPIFIPSPHSHLQPLPPTYIFLPTLKPSLTNTYLKTYTLTYTHSTNSAHYIHHTLTITQIYITYPTQTWHHILTNTPWLSSLFHLYNSTMVVISTISSPIHRNNLNYTYSNHMLNALKLTYNTTP